MRAEEAREMAIKAQGEVDIIGYLHFIKLRAIKGEFDVTFSHVKESQINALIKLGYEIEQYESKLPNQNTITIKW